MPKRGQIRKGGNMKNLCFPECKLFQAINLGMKIYKKTDAEKEGILGCFFMVLGSILSLFAKSASKLFINDSGHSETPRFKNREPKFLKSDCGRRGRGGRTRTPDSDLSGKKSGLEIPDF